MRGKIPDFTWKIYYCISSDSMIIDRTDFPFKG